MRILPARSKTTPTSGNGSNGHREPEPPPRSPLAPARPESRFDRAFDAVVLASERAREWQRYAGAVVIVAVGALVATALSAVDVKNGRLSIMTLGVVLAAFWGGFRAGLVSIALAIFLAEWAVLDPNFERSVSGEEWVSLGVFALSALLGGMVSQAVGRSHRRTIELADQRQQLLVAVLENEERLRTLADAMPVLIARAETDGSITYYNRRMLEYTGKPMDDLLGDGWLSIVHPDEVEQAAARWEQGRQRGERIVFEQRLRRNDGEYRWHLVFGEPVRDSSGRIDYWIGANVDIHDVKLAQQALAVSERRWRSLAEGLPAMVIEADASGRSVYFSPTFIEYTGLSDAELRRDFFQIAHPDDAEEVREISRSAIATRKAASHEWRVRRVDGTYRWHLGIISPILNSDGEVNSWVVAFVDIHDRKVAEQAVQLSEQRWRSLAESLPALVAEADAAGRMTYFSPQLIGFTGLSFQELAADPLRMAHPDEVAQVREMYAQALREGHPITAEWRVRRADGEYRWHLGFMTPARNADGSIGSWVGALIDIHDRKLAERTLRFQNALLHAEQQAAADGILVVDPDGNMISFNERFVEMWGIPPAIVESRSDERAIASVLDKLVDPDAFVARIRELYQNTGEESRDEIHLKDGRVFERYSAPVRSADTFFGRIWWFRDITETKRVEQALRESEQRYRDIFNNVSVSICEEDFSAVKPRLDELRRAGVDVAAWLDEHPDFVTEALSTVRLRAVNDHAVRVFDAESAERLIASFGDVFLPESVPVFREKLIAAAEGRAYFSAEAPLRTLRGETIHVLLQVSFPPPDSAFERVLVTAVDVSDRKRVEAALRWQLALTEAITDSAAVGFMMIDLDGRITFLNPACEQITGLRFDDVRGQVAHDCVHWKYPDGRPFPISECPLDNANERTAPLQDYADVFVRPDGTLYDVVCNLAPVVRDGEQIGALVEIRDVTAEKRAEDRERVLSAVTAALNEASGEQAILDAVASSSQPAFADATAVYRVGEGDGIRHVVVQNQHTRIGHADDHYAIDLEGVLGAAGVLRAGNPVFYPEVPDAFLAAAASSQQHLDHLRALRLRSLIIVPVRVLGSTRLSLTFAQVTSRPFEEEDFVLAQEIARRVGLAIENAQLLEATRQAMAEAEAVRDRLTTITNAVPALIAYVDRDGRYRFNNEGYGEWFGSPASETIGKHVSAVLGADAFEAIHPYMARALQGERCEFEEMIPFAGGARWVRGTYIPDVDRDGAVRGYFALVIDISERKRAEQEQQVLAQLGEALASRAFDATGIAEAIMSAIVPVAADAAALVVRSPDGSVRRHIARAGAPLRHATVAQHELDDPDAVGALAVLRSGQTRFVPSVDLAAIRNVALSEEHFQQLTSEAVTSEVAVPIRIRDEVIAALACATIEARRLYDERDVALFEEIARRAGLAIENSRLYDDARRSERSLAAQVAELETLLDVAPVGIGIAYDAECTDIRTNGAFADMLRIPLGMNASKTGPSAPQLPFRVFREGVEVPTSDLPMQRAGRTGQPVSDERLDMHFSDGSVHSLLSYAAPLFGDDGNVRGVLGAFVDVTAMTRLEDDLRAANAAKDEFLGLVSHELKTPITTIMGNAEVLHRRGDMLDDRARSEALRDIQHESQRLHQIIENLLTLARLEQGREIEMEPLLIARLVEKLVAEHRDRHPHRDIRIVSDGEPLPVVAAQVYLEQVIRNLLSNAEKYSPSHEPIEVIIIRGETAVQVQVCDHGVGIPLEDRDMIFNPFFRARSAGHVAGVGIGLAVCKRLIEVQGGEIGYVPRPEGGSCFTATLPAYADEEF